jgi:hypothetical protein
MKCICCSKEVKELCPDWKDVPPMWSGGATGKIDAGYGSSYDLDTFTFIICDDCIKEKLSNNLISIQ